MLLPVGLNGFHAGAPGFDRMVFRRPRGSCSSGFYLKTLGIVLLLIAPVSASAEAGAHPLKLLQQKASMQKNYLPVRLFNQMAEKYSLKADDLRLRALFSAEEAKKLQEQRAKETPVDPLSDRKILFHLVKSKGGEQVVSQSDIRKSIRAKIEQNKSKLDRVVSKRLKASGQAIQEELKIESLPSCTEDKTETTHTNGIPPEFRNKHSHDVLFVPPKYATTSTAELFGEKTKLIVYDPTKSGPQTTIAKSVGATCLPYRVRTTGTVLFQHYGAPALRNYDGDPYGEGEKLF